MSRFLTCFHRFFYYLGFYGSFYIRYLSFSMCYVHSIRFSFIKPVICFNFHCFPTCHLPKISGFHSSNNIYYLPDESGCIFFLHHSTCFARIKYRPYNFRKIIPKIENNVGVETIIIKTLEIKDVYLSK